MRGTGQPECLPVVVIEAGGVAQGECRDHRQRGVIRQPGLEPIRERLPQPQQAVAVGVGTALAAAHRRRRADALTEQPAFVIEGAGIDPAVRRTQYQPQPPALAATQAFAAAIPGNADLRRQCCGIDRIEAEAPGRGCRIAARFAVKAAVAALRLRQRGDHAFDGDHFAEARRRPATVDDPIGLERGDRGPGRERQKQAAPAAQQQGRDQEYCVSPERRKIRALQQRQRAERERHHQRQRLIIGRAARPQPSRRAGRAGNESVSRSGHPATAARASSARGRPTARLRCDPCARPASCRG